MVAVELLVVSGLFVVVVVGGADGGAGALVGPVGQDQGLPGQAGFDDAVGPSRGQVMGAAGSERENQSGVPSGVAITCTFMPCLRCFCE